MRACDDEVGRPHNQVSTSQTMAPTKPGDHDILGDDVELDHALADGLGNGGAQEECREEVESTRPRRPPDVGESTRVETTVAMLLAAS